MKSYKQVFSELKTKKQGALAPFVVIGDPDYLTSLEIVKKIVDAGADILELGLPFSDPIADGPTIQAANVRALNNGINTDKTFEYIKEVREYSDIPIGILTYYNLAYQRGLDRFYSDCKKSGINSLLIADMPIEESETVIKASCENEINTVFMVSQLTDNERIKKIAQRTTGFIYAVARLGVTGAKSNLKKSALKLVKRVKSQTDKPICVGFGLSRGHQLREVIKAGADGVIIGSALIDLIEKNLGDNVKMMSELYDYVKELKRGTLI
jgi:tryptophan synthase alpha chain